LKKNAMNTIAEVKMSPSPAVIDNGMEINSI